MGEKTLNVIELAKLARTSKSTVSRVLRNEPDVSPKTRARIQRLIEKYDYHPSLFGRGLTGASTGLIGVLGRWMESGFAAEVLRGIVAEVERRGGHLLCSFAPNIDDYVSMWRKFASGGQVDGAILIAPASEIFSHPVKPGDRPVVLCACKPPDESRGWGNVGSVISDNFAAMDDLVKHLVEKGCRRLVHLSGPPDILDAQERRRFFMRCASKYRGVKASVVQGAWTRELAYTITLEYINTHGSPPDAFVAFNDSIALGVLEALDARGIAVPDKVAVTGWDDILFASYAGLTTIHLPMIRMGEEAARLLYEQLDDKRRKTGRQTVLKMPLKIRRTSGGPGKQVA